MVAVARSDGGSGILFGVGCAGAHGFSNKKKKLWLQKYIEKKGWEALSVEVEKYFLAITFKCDK